MKKTNNLITSAVIYARFSSDMQREESIEAQIRACWEWAARNNIEIVGEYIDRAKSATSDQRPEFQRMIQDAANGTFSAVIVHKLDRFSRNRYDSAHYKHQLKRHGITLRSVVENLDGSPESVIMESVLEGMAEYYSLNLAREVEKGKRENALKGKYVGGRPPLGYDVDRETMTLVVNPHEAQAVKIIFSMYLDSATYSEIINVLGDRGFVTKWGEPFGNNSLHSILKNPKYTGVYTYSRSASKDIDGKRNGHAYKPDDEIIKVEGAVPALISQEDFAQVQERMKFRKQKAGKHKAKRLYLLSGKVYCGTCETAYIGNCRPTRSDHPEYISYRCNNRAKRPRCSGWEIRSRTIESIVLGELSTIVFDDAMIPTLVEGYRQYLMEQNKNALAVQEELSRRILAIQKDMDSIMSVIIQTSSDALVGKLNSLDAQKQELIRKLHKAQADNNIVGPSEDELGHSFKLARKMLQSGQLPTVQALVERYVHKVIVSGENIEIQFNLNISSRVVSYPADPLVTPMEKKIPHPSRQETIGVFTFAPTQRLAAYGGEGGI
jgi:site-specific DNA recombinase